MSRLRSRVAWSKFGRDILVIILGVLVALAFDNWSSARADRRLERQYLARLTRDLRADSAMLAEYSRKFVVGSQAAQALLGLVNDPQKPAADTVIARYFSDATRGAYLNSNTPTIDELKATGNLRVIKSAQLRDALLTYYSEVGRFQRNLENVMRRGRDPLGELGWDIGAFDLALAYAVTLLESQEHVDASSPALAPRDGTLLTRFRRQPDVERLTRRAITYNEILHPMLADWERILTSLQARVRVES